MENSNNDAAAALKMDTCVKLVSGITDCFLKDRENSRQVYYRELDYLDSRESDKNEIKLEKIKLKKLKIKKQIKEIEAENFRYELDVKLKAFETAVDAEVRIQSKKIKSQERVAIKKIEYLNNIRKTVSDFYLALISELTERYNDLDTECGDLEITQNERLQLQHLRDNVDTQLEKTQQNFNQCIKELTDAIDKIQLTEISTKNLYLNNNLN